MSYRIVYGPMPQPTRPRNGSMLRVQIWTAVFLLLFSLLVRQFWPEGIGVLRSVLIPVEPTVTEQALSVMLTDLRTGIPVEDALTAFCRQIIDGQTN